MTNAGQEPAFLSVEHLAITTEKRKTRHVQFCVSFSPATQIMAIRPILFEVETPFRNVPRVVLYRDSWELKIAKRTDFHRAWVEDTVRSPSCVVRGTTNPRHVAFVSERYRSPGTNSPLVVFVSELGYPHPVVSVGFRRDFRNLEAHDVLWSR